MTTEAPVLQRAAYRPFLARANRVQRLSPHFVRITFTGPEFEHFGTAGLDQRIKLVFPFADGRMSDFGQHDEECKIDGSWYQRWRALPDDERNPLRTYTVRRIDPAAGELDVDFVLHHDPGPAGEWAERAAPGDELVIVGPDERSEQSRLGLDWRPGTASRLLLVGDETAVPAIGGILASLPADRRADVFVEVPTADDGDVLDAPGHARVRTLPREGADHGSRLISALAEWADTERSLLAAAAAPRPQQVAEIDVDRELLWDSPDPIPGEFYAWIAGEAATVKILRRLLVREHGVDRRRVAFMGYFRLGQSERQG